jgi:hypothetical protein
MKSSIALLSLAASALAAPTTVTNTVTSCESTATACSAAASSSGFSLTLDQQLELAVTQVERISILAANGGNSSFLFDFNNPPTAAVAENTTNGSVVAALGASFPALIGLDAAAIKFSLGPCGLIMPHTHPRADEFIVTTEGTIFTQFLTESGSELISNNISTYQSTIFPKGSIHFEFNPTCQDAIFLGFFNSNDPGTTLVPENLFSFDETIIISQFDGIISGADFEAIVKALPPGPVSAVESCLATCGIQKSGKRSVYELIK